MIKRIKWYIPKGMLEWYGRQVQAKAVQQRRAKAAALIECYLTEHESTRIQLGCGTNPMQGWLNTDYDDRDPEVAFLDCTEAFPLPDGRFDYVFSEHLIEHLDYADGCRMLEECYRILRPEGKIRISTPNFNFLLELCKENKSDLQRKYIQWCAEMWSKVYQPDVVFVVNNFFREWKHQFIYSPDVLSDALKKAGFQNPTIQSPGQSDDPNLNNIEKHGKVIGEDFNMLETFSIEARK